MCFRRNVLLTGSKQKARVSSPTVREWEDGQAMSEPNLIGSGPSILTAKDAAVFAEEHKGFPSRSLRRTLDDFGEDLP